MCLKHLHNSQIHQVSKKYVSKELAKEIHAKAAPFVKWLKEAEEESEGSEEEEEEEDENVEVRLLAGFHVKCKLLCTCLRRSNRVRPT